MNKKKIALLVLIGIAIILVLIFGVFKNKTIDPKQEVIQATQGRDNILPGQGRG